MKLRPGHLVTLLCLAFSGLCLFNVLGDNREVEALAKASTPSCKPDCAATRIERTPFSQEFEFSVKGGSTVLVRCTRSALVLGPYACQPR